ncbi:MAG: NifB/NifX family molybdenum-iron cluster-binding protein [Pseudomonadota bacterium]|nr:NifB/NifX family molybdenum-iron cluster-binding protein [Pseudomonadota bacterium]
MLIAFSVDNNNEKAMMDSRFGRCPFFALLEDQSGEIEYVANPAAGASMGAGTGAAQMLINRDVAVVVSGQVGPKALEILEATGTPIYLTPAELPFSIALQRYQEGQLQQYRLQRF